MGIEKERKAFEAVPEIKQWVNALRYGEKTGVYIAIDNDKHEGVASWVNGAWWIWQAAKAHETKKLDGCVVVSNKPYAYIIKHKHWSDSTPTEIYLATEFVGDGCVEKEKLIICIPLYKGEEAAFNPLG